MRLDPLAADAVSQLAADILQAQPDEKLLQKAEMMRGNPFLLVEFFRGLQEDGIVAVEAGRTRLIDDRVPRRVSDSIESACRGCHPMLKGSPLWRPRWEGAFRLAISQQ